jgi:carboxypeptidase Q
MQELPACKRKDEPSSCYLRLEFTTMELPVVPQEASDTIFAECFGRPRAYYELGKLCDSVGGRTSGAPSGTAGEEWAAELMHRWGLENVRFEEFPVLCWTRGPLSITAAVPDGASWQLTAIAHGFCPEEAEIDAELISVGHGEEGDYLAAGDSVKGRVVLCDEGVAEGNRRLHRSEKLLLAAKYGAAALFMLSSASGGLPRTGTCSRAIAPIPGIGISQEDGLRLLRLMDHGITPCIQLSICNSVQNSTARNVVGELRGSEAPDEVVLAGGHLDSWDVATGATDNGLGSAIVLEMGRVLASLSRRPRRTLRFAIWAAEEIGLLGSHHYAHLHAAELNQHAAVLNFDMTADPYGYWMPGTPGSFADAPGMEVMRKLSSLLAPIGMRNEFVHKAGLHSDHQPFMLAGVQAIALLAENKTQGAHYYHSVGDTFDKVSLPAMCRASAVGACTMWALADLQEMPFPRRTTLQVREMIDAADLYGALQAEGYDGPPMHI